jgi:hypothetical protein
MTIARLQYEGIGARVFMPAGPYILGQFPLPDPAFGTVVDGDAGAEFIFLKYAPVASTTLNQGDVVVWDAKMMAVPAKLGSAYHPWGANVGVVYFGGSRGDTTSNQAGNIWTYTFAAGTYGIWVQRAGACVAHYAVVTAQADATYTTAGAGAVSALSAGATSSETIQGMYSGLTTGTFTASAVSGASTMTSVSDTNNLEIGLTLSGTSVTGGTYITDIQGSTIYLSQAVTGTISTGTITWKSGTTFPTVAAASGATSITVGNIPGIFPGATLTGTNVSSVISSISGKPGAYVINLATATTGAVAVTVSLAATIYVEAFLSWPFITAQN